MNKKSRLTVIKKLFSILAGVFCIVLLSCNNFLEGSSFKEQLEEDIAYAKAKECRVIIKSDATYGSFLSDGEKTFKLGYDSPVQFTVKTESYAFKGLEAVSSTNTSQSRSECVQFTALESDDKKGVYKLNVKLIKAADDILIRPVCTLLPKISSISPALEANGCNQDSAITIAFNKNMNPESFKDSNGTITGLSITNGDDEDLSAYFAEPYFASDNKTLVILPLCCLKDDTDNIDNTKYLLPPDESKSSLTIKVNYTFVDVKDEDGLSFTENGTHNYKINKNFNEQEEVTVIVQNPDSSYGSFLSAGEKSCVVGFGFDIEFTLNTESYNFGGFEAVSKNDTSLSRAEYVAYENEQNDEKNGVYKAKVRVLKAASDILIRPKCTLIENAEVTITKSEKGTDTISPADGTKVQSFIERSYSVSFSPDEDYEFIRWELYDIKTDAAITNGTYVTLKDPTQSSTTYEVTQIPDTAIELALRPIVTRRPQILSGTPAYSNAGSLKDSTIQVIFNHDMSEDSIYYTKDEISSLKSNRITNFLTTVNDKTYGYTDSDGEVHFKNIVIKDNRTNGNLLGYFSAPSFETSKILSIPVNKSLDFPSYTQIYVCIEKEFFFEEDSVQVTLSSYKDWVYWVTDETDTSAPVLIKKDGSDFTVSKESSSSAWESKTSDNCVEANIPSFNFIKNNKIYLKMALQDTGSGPASTFNMTLTKKMNSSYKTSDTSYTHTLSYTGVSGTIAYYDGEIDLNSFVDESAGQTFEEGVYGATFEFTDQSGNSIVYPSDSKAFYFAYDNTAPENSKFAVKNGNSNNEYVLSWTNASDSDFSKSVVTITGATETTYDNITGTSQTINLEAGKSYKITVTSYDYAGNNSTYKYDKILTGFTVSESTKQVLFSGTPLCDNGVTATAYFSDLSTDDVSSSAIIASPETNIASEVEATFTFGEITKKVSLTGTYLVAKSDAKTESPVKLTGYKGTLDGGTYYKFGDFPQTVSTLTGDNAYTSDPVYNGWYLGSDGYFYAKCTENGYSSSYTYSDGETKVAQASASSEKYFKVEPIKWRVLNPSADGNKILVAESILTAKVAYYDYHAVNRTIGKDTVYPSNYKHSKIRAYLNGLSYAVKEDDSAEPKTDSTYNGNGFLQTAFTTSAQKLIADTVVDNSADSTTDPGENITKASTYACDNTSDKIFLLSEEEATTTDYGFTAYDVYGTENNRIRVPTDYAKANYAYTFPSNVGWWWLRSPYYSSSDGDSSSNYARVVNEVGNASSKRNYVDRRDGGVVPALCVAPGALE
ncbi:MAG: DUF6273 domain-containing protein [Treponema sp.]|nr:DUF6273 domain-containing protein [Treponema sp.]